MDFKISVNTKNNYLVKLPVPGYDETKDPIILQTPNNNKDP